MKIPISQPSITSRERKHVLEAIDSGWISSLGEFIPLFQDMLAEKVQRKHALACSNGTVALELALRALGIGPGDEVIVPAFTFVSPAAVVKQVGATPVFVDIHPDHWTINIDLIPSAITERTKAVIAVDVLGHPFDWFFIKDRLKAGNITLIEDAAEAHGAKHRYNFDSNWKQIDCGRMGDISTFSFYGNKTISTGEGGAILTDDTELFGKIKLIANHGMRPERNYWHEVVGMNGRMTNITAAIGVAQMERWEELVTARRLVAKHYDERLSDLFAENLLHRKPVAHWASESCWLYSVYSDQRQLYLDNLHHAGIDARAVWPMLPDNPAYAGSKGQWPVAKK